MTDFIRAKVASNDLELVVKTLRDLDKELATKTGRKALRKAAGVTRDAISLEAEKRFSRGRVRGTLTNVVVRIVPKRELARRGRHVLAYFVALKKPAYHWHLMEYGTGPRTQETTGRYTGYVEARPFIGPGFHKSKERALNVLLDELAVPFKKLR